MGYLFFRAAFAAALAIVMVSGSANAETSGFFKQPSLSEEGGPPELPKADGPPELPEVDGPPDLPTISYYVGIRGEKVGPLDHASLEARVKTGELKSDTLVWTKGMQNWEQASTRDDLTAILKAAPKVVTPSFDAQKFVAGKWSISGSNFVPGMGQATVTGTEIYAANGGFSGTYILTITQPSAQLVQAGLTGSLKLTVSLTGSYTIKDTVGKTFSTKVVGTLTLRDQNGFGMNSSEPYNETSMFESLDDNTFKNTVEDLIARRVN